MEERNNSFVFYASVFDTYEALLSSQPQMAAKFLEAVCSYGIYGEFDDSDPVLIALMTQVKVGIDNARKRYDAAVANGSRGGAPKKYDEDAIVDFVLEGHTQKEASEKFHCPERTVRRYVRARKAIMKTVINEDGTFNF